MTAVISSPSAHPRQFARRIPRLAAALAVFAACWDIAVNQAFEVRILEARVCAWLLQHAGVDGVKTAFRDRVVMVPKPGVLFSGVITVSCSALFPVLAMAVLTLAVIPGSIVQRMQRFLLATFILTSINFLRLCIVLATGATRGMNAMAPVHEWVGSLVTLFGWVLTLVLMLKLARRHRTQATTTKSA
jgi:exosortase/archaeosortase family protein